MKNLLLLIAFTVFLAGCGEVGDASPAPEPRASVGRLRIYTDPDTKCQYIQPRGSKKSPLMPRVDANGKHICGALVLAPLHD